MVKFKGKMLCMQMEKKKLFTLSLCSQVFLILGMEYSLCMNIPSISFGVIKVQVSMNRRNIVQREK